MRLYKMELYKLYHRKIFIIGAVCVIALMLLFFWADVFAERTYVNGVHYAGYKAIQVNRQITEEFKGVLTDEEIEQIIEKYGFPQVIAEDSDIRDSNFLNQFVMDFFSDGYVYHWDDYKIATKIYPIADTAPGEAREITGKEIILEYGRGWEVFEEVLSVGMMCGSILILFGISVVFSNESQLKMLQLLFTSQNGKKKDTCAKIAASFTIAAGIWITVVTLDFVMCALVYGVGGWNCFSGMVIGGFYPAGVNLISCGSYMMITVLFSLAGILSLCAITICVSAYCANSFHAVVLAASCWGAPLLLFIISGFPLLIAMPIWLVYYDILFDFYPIWPILVWIALVVMVVCTIKAYQRYRKRQVV